MNKIKYFMLACLLSMAATASAQFANSKGSTSVGSADATEWNGFRFSYHPLSLVPDKGDSMGMTGLSVGYAKGIALSQSTPLFLEVGANVMWTSKDLTDEVGYDDDDISVKLNMFSVNVPVNFGYKHAFSDNMSIYPYVGVNFRVNAIGNMKAEAYGESESISVFDKDDMDGDAWKRFQAGWQIGVALNINKFMIAASYGKDFTEISKKTKIAMPSITVGINF